MKVSRRQIAVSACVVLVFFGAIWIWHKTHLPQNPLIDTNKTTEPPSTKNIESFDDFQNDLATHVLQQFGADDSKDSDFSVIVATAAYPVGTLLRPSSSVPADFNDCVPSLLPKALAASRLFPSYTLSTDTALTANVGSKILQGLTDADASFERSAKLQYSVADTEIQIMDDKSVDQVTKQGNCGEFITAHPGTRLVRGIVTGKMTYTVQVSNPASVKAELEKVGAFKVDDNPGSSTISVADLQSEPIVELLSEFNNNGNAANPGPAPKPITTAKIQAPAESPKAHMYVQQDSDDSSDSGQQVVKLLTSGWPTANVESNVTRVPSSKMPATAEIRFFNAEDEKFAAKCLGILRQKYPKARIVRFGLPAPKGQLEVWLPRAPSTAAVAGH